VKVFKGGTETMKGEKTKKKGGRESSFEDLSFLKDPSYLQRHQQRTGGRQKNETRSMTEDNTKLFLNFKDVQYRKWTQCLLGIK
jgi:hypothetical protein